MWCVSFSCVKLPQSHPFQRNSLSVPLSTYLQSRRSRTHTLLCFPSSSFLGIAKFISLFYGENLRLKYHRFPPFCAFTSFHFPILLFQTKLLFSLSLLLAAALRNKQNEANISLGCEMGSNVNGWRLYVCAYLLFWPRDIYLCLIQLQRCYVLTIVEFINHIASTQLLILPYKTFLWEQSSLFTFFFSGGCLCGLRGSESI